jgi:hypothetical protein
MMMMVRDRGFDGFGLRYDGAGLVAYDLFPPCYTAIAHVTHVLTKAHMYTPTAPCLVTRS